MNKTQRSRQTPSEPAVPCAACSSPTAWRSAYGGQLRCAVCEPWPSLAMVGERWTLYVRPGGAFEWIPALRKGERVTTRQEASQGPQDECDGFTWQDVDDETGSWVVITKVRNGR